MPKKTKDEMRMTNRTDFRPDPNYKSIDKEKEKLVLKLGTMITDRYLIKYTNTMKTTDPEFWALNAVLTKEEVKFLLSFKKTRVPYSLEEIKQMVRVLDAVFAAASAHILPGTLLEIQERVIDIHQDGGYILFSEHYGRYRSVSGFQQERNLVALAQAAVHHADYGNRSLDAEFHIGLAVNVLLKNETGALAVQVEA